VLRSDSGSSTEKLSSGSSSRRKFRGVGGMIGARGFRRELIEQTVEKQAGPLVPARSQLGGSGFSEIEVAPGKYVKERSR
jgi:hypothetical protein